MITSFRKYIIITSPDSTSKVGSGEVHTKGWVNFTFKWDINRLEFFYNGDEKAPLHRIPNYLIQAIHKAIQNSSRPTPT